MAGFGDFDDFGEDNYSGGGAAAPTQARGRLRKNTGLFLILAVVFTILGVIALAVVSDPDSSLYNFRYLPFLGTLIFITLPLTRRR